LNTSGQREVVRGEFGNFGEPIKEFLSWKSAGCWIFTG